MTYRGHVENGTVVLDQPAELPDGARVEIRLVHAGQDTDTQEERVPTVAERLAPFIGRLKGLPADLSANHDHYLYGARKRQ